MFGITFCGIRLDGTIDAPGPVTIHGRLTVETFLKDFHFDETFTFGSPGGPPADPAGARRAGPQGRGGAPVGAARGRAAPTATSSSPRCRCRPALALVLPRGGVAWQQKRVPLDDPHRPARRRAARRRRSASRRPCPTRRRVSTTCSRPAPSSRSAKAEALNRPAFENLPAGVVSSGGADRTGATRPQATKPQVFRKVKGEGWGALGLSALVAREFPGILLSMVAARDAASVVATEATLVTVGAETWVSTHDGAAHDACHRRLPGREAQRRAVGVRRRRGRSRRPGRAGGSVMPDVRRLAAPASHRARDGAARHGAAGRRPADHAPRRRRRPGRAGRSSCSPGPATSPRWRAARSSAAGRTRAPSTSRRRCWPTSSSPRPTCRGATRRSPTRRPPRACGRGSCSSSARRPRSRCSPTAASASPGRSCSRAIRSAQSTGWAHVHDVAGRRFARIVCPRQLTVGQDYLAVLVPAWQATVAADGSTTLADSWPTASGSATLPCFDRWTFRTSAEHGDFSTIARRLEPLTRGRGGACSPSASSAARRVTVGPLPDTTLSTGGALHGRAGPGRSADRRAAAAAGRRRRRAPRLDARRRRPLGADAARATTRRGIPGRSTASRGSGRRRATTSSRTAGGASCAPIPATAARPGSARGRRSRGRSASPRAPPARRPPSPPRPSASGTSRSGSAPRAACGRAACPPIRWRGWRRCRPCSPACPPTAAAARSTPSPGAPRCWRRPVLQHAPGGCCARAGRSPAPPRPGATALGGLIEAANRCPEPQPIPDDAGRAARPAGRRRRARGDRGASCASARSGSCSRSRATSGWPPRPARRWIGDPECRGRARRRAAGAGAARRLPAAAGPRRVRDVGRRRHRSDRRAPGRRRPRARLDHRPAAAAAGRARRRPRARHPAVEVPLRPRRPTGCSRAPATSRPTACWPCRRTRRSSTRC